MPPAPARRPRPVRVAVLDHTAELGGAELALVRSLEALDPAVVEPVVVLFSSGPLEERLRAAGHRVVVVPLDAGVRDVGRAAGPADVARSAVAGSGFLMSLVRTLRRLDVDVVHATSLKADLLGAPAARLLGLPLVWHVHDRIAEDYLPARTVRAFRALARRVPSAVVANSAATAATLPGARGLTVAHPGLSPDQVAASPRRHQPEGPPVVGMVGRLSPTKGQLVLVRAARRIVDARPGTRFRLVGAAAFGAEDYEKQVRREIDRLGLADVVELTGFVADPRAELDALSVCVHASTVPEPFGQVVTEAMAWGVPVVATRGGGVDEIVRTQPPGADTGLLVAPDDDEALATAVLEALDRPGEALDRAARAHADVASRFRANHGAATLTRVWLESAGARPSPAPSQSDRPRVAIAHDYLTQRGGAERVVLALHRAFPDATIHTTLYDPDGTYPEFRDASVVVSPINKIAPLRREHRAALPLLPYAVSRLRVDADVVVVSSSGWAHGVPATGRKLVYCHAPARWLYQADAYLGEEAGSSVKARALSVLSGWLRRWDRRAASSADRYLANSTVVRERIATAYGIDAEVLAPPYGIDPADPQEPVAALADWADAGYLLVVSRLLPYKNVDVAVEAVRGLPERLVVVGAGPLEARLRAEAPDNVRIVTGLTDAELRWTYAHARTLLAPSLEDFGLTPLEAAAFGVPTLALHAGGYLDTIDESVNGVFFEEPTTEAVRAAVVAARDRAWDASAIRAHADQFSEARFHERIRSEVERLLAP
ncbi:glycosyltransferase [Terrabacter sp. C0L_2]|uniref:glycosyltransferase n=1 Tax=Terrabacter sp. C0L_2 TaxID=3108389 RepID=UPI002ED012EF|nr:glycosyltransferase [Terrabacter sp. C0L_2]